MSIFKQLETLIVSYAPRVPLELFVSIGAFIEEVIAPIPSPFVMTTAGTLASLQQRSIIFIIWLSIIGAVGKTLGAWVLYFLADKAEDIVMSKFGQFIAVSHREIENIGRHLNKGWKTNLMLLLIRTLPVLPSAPISIVCGVLKINLGTYLGATFIGIILRNLIFMYFGYVGLNTFKSVVNGLETLESITQAVLVFIIGGLIIWAYHQRGNKNFLNQIKNKLSFKK